MEISIIVPVHNEQDNLVSLNEKIHKICQDKKYEFQILFINDGSTDDSQLVLSNIYNNYQETVKIIELYSNHGQTSAIMAGIDQAEGDVIIPIDADLQNDPNDIPLLLNKLAEGYDVVSGWRVNRKDNLFSRVYISKIANKLISKVSGVHLHDYGCSLKAYKKEFLKPIKLYGEMHRFIPIYAKDQGAKIAEVPVNHYPRQSGKSHYGMERTAKVVLDLFVSIFLLKFSGKPIYIFGGFGLISHFVAILIFILMLYFKFFGDKSFIATPLPLIATLFLLVGFISILMGLLAELLVRIYFESQRKATYKIKSITCM